MKNSSKINSTNFFTLKISGFRRDYGCFVLKLPYNNKTPDYQENNYTLPKILKPGKKITLLSQAEKNEIKFKPKKSEQSEEKEFNKDKLEELLYSSNSPMIIENKTQLQVEVDKISSNINKSLYDKDKTNKKSNFSHMLTSLNNKPNSPYIEKNNLIENISISEKRQNLISSEKNNLVDKSVLAEINKNIKNNYSKNFLIAKYKILKIKQNVTNIPLMKTEYDFGFYNNQSYRSLEHNGRFNNKNNNFSNENNISREEDMKNIVVCNSINNSFETFNQGENINNIDINNKNHFKNPSIKNIYFGNAKDKIDNSQKRKKLTISQTNLSKLPDIGRRVYIDYRNVLL